jgi:hypothetical protein
MKGVARDYNSLAYQSEVMGKNRYFKDQIFSNFALTQEGRVGFIFETMVDPALLDYSKRVSGGINTELATPTGLGTSTTPVASTTNPVRP